MGSGFREGNFRMDTVQGREWKERRHIDLRRLTDVVTKEGGAPQRTLMEFQLTESTPMPRCSTLTIHNADGSYSEDYQHLTNDFYLKF